MLNNKLKPHTLYNPISIINEYGETITSYQSIGTYDMAISLNTHAVYSGNDYNIVNCEFVAYMKYKGIGKGMVIDNRYTVEYVIESRLGAIALLKEVGNSGRTNL